MNMVTRVYRVQLHRYMRGVVRMVTKCCYREVILALSRENLVSVLVCRCNLCILSKAPTSCVVLYRNTLKALHVQFKQMSSSPVSLFRDSTKYPVIHLCNFVSVVFNQTRHVFDTNLLQISMIGGILHNRETPSDLSALGSCCDAKTYKTSKK